MGQRAPTIPASKPATNPWPAPQTRL